MMLTILEKTMAIEKATPSMRYSQLKAGEQASHAHLPIELIKKIMEFLKDDPKSLARYLAVDRRSRAQSKFFNTAWKKHALENNSYYNSLLEIHNLPEGSDENYKLKIAQILNKAKGEELADKYEEYIMGPPGPDAEALETNPDAGKANSDKEMGNACLPGLMALAGFIAGASIAYKADFNRSGSIAFCVLTTLLGLLLGSIPIIYPCIQACRVKQQIKENELQANVLAHDEEKGEKLPLLTMRRG